ncbi:hypothetical protein D3C81_1885810 [compost metagenome]
MLVHEMVAGAKVYGPLLETSTLFVGTPSPSEGLLENAIVPVIIAVVTIVMVEITSPAGGETRLLSTFLQI